MRQLQQDFVGAILNGSHKIYHNNFLVSHTKALREIYPAVYRLIGQECFENTAAVYIPQHLSESYKLQDYGKLFPDFLQKFLPLQSLPYLSDVARLEWAIHEIFYEKDDMLSATRFINSVYPVLSIWELCREEESEKTLDLSKGGENILLRRKNREIVFIHIGESQ
ncbi:MAG TPA: DNA-binding domain-containing protein [Gammaproteobacteria bacterium]|nr:DNA-binding domain-containing protein [Gammaproteobacteria bacterium]